MRSLPRGVSARIRTGAILTVALLAIGALVFFTQHSFFRGAERGRQWYRRPVRQDGISVCAFRNARLPGGRDRRDDLSGGYNLCQFYNPPWGKNRKAREVPTFSLSWIGMLGIAALPGLSGFDPLKLANISVVFGMVVMPLTYYPIMRAARDKGIIREHVNSRTDTAIGILFLILMTMAALAAIPLMILTNSGER